LLVPWARRLPVTVMVRPVDAQQTQITAESSLRQPRSTSLEAASRTVKRFFRELLLQLPPPPVPSLPSQAASEGLRDG